MLSAVVGGGLPSCGGRPPWGLFVSRVLLGLSDWAEWAVLSCVVSTFEVYVMFRAISIIAEILSLYLICSDFYRCLNECQYSSTGK